MKKKLTVLLLCSVLAASGCGSAGSAGGTDSAAESTESTTSEESAGGEAEEAAPEEEADTGTTYDEAPIADTEMTAENAAEFVTLAEYKGIEIELPADTAIETGMVAGIDYVGTIDGTAFEGGTGSYDLEIGSHSFIDDFEDQLVGHKAGEKVDVNVTFPEDYGSEELAGKDAVFAVTINKVYRSTPDMVLSDIVAHSKVLQYPKDITDNWMQYLIDQYSSMSQTDSTASSDTKKPETLAELAELTNIDEETLKQQMLTNAKAGVVARAILFAEGVTREDELYTETLSSLLETSGLGSVETAVQNGIPEFQIYYIGDIQTAQKIIVNNQKTA